MNWTAADLAEHYGRLKKAQPCQRCRGTKVVSVKHSNIYCTDSDDEIALAYHDEPCPKCANDATVESPDVPEALIESECTKILECDGWRALRTDPVSRRAFGKGFGELGMADHQYLRYLHGDRLQIPTGYAVLKAPAAEVLWIEFKRAGEKAKKHQQMWHIKERSRGALTLIAGEDFEASVTGFAAWYRNSGLMRSQLAVINFAGDRK